jgi:zinc protease
MTGAAFDPQGKEGLAALTAALLAQGGTRTMAYDQIVEAMYPLATSFGWQVDKEMTVFTGTTHIDNLDKYYRLISQMLLDPGFREDDFKRLKADAINFLKVSLREGNDEELGKEYLYNVIYDGHPYEHHNIGTLSSLEKLTLEDVRAFYKANYTRSNLVVGLAGGFPKSFPTRLENDFSKLPEGQQTSAKFETPKLASGMRISIILASTARATVISINDYAKRAGLTTVIIPISNTFPAGCFSSRPILTLVDRHRFFKSGYGLSFLKTVTSYCARRSTNTISSCATACRKTPSKPAGNFSASTTTF